MAKLTYFIKKKIGKEIHSFSVEGDNFHELIMASKNLSFYGVDSCGKCGSDDLALGAHIAGPKKHKYVTIKCKKCKAFLNFGQQQENPEIYYLRTVEGPDKKKVLDWKDANTPVEDGQ
jgi:late competence protein required for DNA uptake (superfamily II DNA/RNA helicase)